MHALVADHVVRARVVLPGAAYLELARAAWCALASPSPPPTGAAQLRGVFFLQPLALEASGGLHVECAVGAGGRFEVRSGEPVRSGGGTLDDPAVHCTGAMVAAADGASWARLDLAAKRAGDGAHAVSVAALYDAFDAAGLQYGPGYRALLQAWGGGDGGAASARLRARRSARDGTVVHPADLDGALQLSAVATSGRGGGRAGETRLPFAVDDARLCGAAGEPWAVRACARACHRSR